MGFLKEKSAYRPTPLERALAWALTLAAAAVVGFFLVRDRLGGS